VLVEDASGTEREIRAPAAVAVRYLRGWFFIDLFSRCGVVCRGRRVCERGDGGVRGTVGVVVVVVAHRRRLGGAADGQGHPRRATTAWRLAIAISSFEGR